MPKSLIGQVVSTQQIAMHQQRPYPEQVDNVRVKQQGNTGFLTKLVAQQKIPVTLLKINCGARCCKFLKGRTDFGVGRANIIIAHPGIKKIAQYV